MQGFSKKKKKTTNTSYKVNINHNVQWAYSKCKECCENMSVILWFSLMRKAVAGLYSSPALNSLTHLCVQPHAAQVKRLSGPFSGSFCQTGSDANTSSPSSEPGQCMTDVHRQWAHPALRLRPWQCLCLGKSETRQSDWEWAALNLLLLLLLPAPWCWITVLVSLMSSNLGF